MKRTSDAWKANQALPLTSEGYVEISYKISDPDMNVTGVVSNGTLEPLSMAEGLKAITEDLDRDVAPYATLEKDLWLLDGSRMTIPEEGPAGYGGYISEALCDGSGTFHEAPHIDISLHPALDILPGVTIAWGAAFDDYPTRFTVTPCKGGVPYEGREVDGNESVVSIVEFEMRDFDQVAIEIIEWSRPYRRARIAKAFMGINKAYTKSDLLRFSCSHAVDPVSASLPKYEVAFEIDNRDGAFNPKNEDGLGKYMMERQEIRTRYGYRLDGRMEWVGGGVYYLSDWSAPVNGLSASFKARDLLGFMNAPYHGGEFRPEGISLYELALEVLGDAGLPRQRDGSDPWVLDEGALGRFDTMAPLPDCSFGECLQLIANAALCVIFFDEEGKMHMEPLGLPEESLEIDNQNSYSRAEISLTRPLCRVDVSWHDYAAGGESTEEVVSIYGQDGEAPLGRQWPGEVVPLKNALITSADHARAAGLWIQGHLDHRKRASLDWRMDPALEVLDAVKVGSGPDPFRLRVTSFDLGFAGAFKGKLEGMVEG